MCVSHVNNLLGGRRNCAARLETTRDIRSGRHHDTNPESGPVIFASKFRVILMPFVRLLFFFALLR
ncbi:hypothetical protein PISMIDRAFT_676369 [Pisolithus microcarpus 441]|uniref:Uncharacterized protein n=1 Tax=Pisolithus microcarpus 441 TaxID=765257 RepID=A0A0C9ZVG3_9AGAM|nr:hypothetical protein BKA83DRAFT_676369 [Pisolithus microcarpus]KIK26212.1 hypothetical protein PISMIDRAFT_676369 [Pisolithus microcarpus 441]